MKNKNDNDRDRTAEIRAALSFLQFIENKIINKQVYKINSLDMKDIENFSEFMSLHIRR